MGDFGQSGDTHALYRHYGIDAEHKASAAFATLEAKAEEGFWQGSPRDFWGRERRGTSGRVA